ncbi:hypothetical protein RYJ27_01635 [Microbacterium limosum]|uniref:Uncharacterized protein n=1 Tax=Microbacterium limosum TaxID=3079935 RepID=A0AAU0MH82_9MICO|nr:hypothetical protein [Microbacterium sp. Y20]WOQ69965.1 hypothetical protein RYJ27_01635 [Microbacterium sp. Y20]
MSEQQAQSDRKKWTARRVIVLALVMAGAGTAAYWVSYLVFVNLG